MPARGSLVTGSVHGQVPARVRAVSSQEVPSPVLTAVILIPAIVCVAALLLDSPARAFRNVVLPVLFFCPSIYFWKVTLLPPITFEDAALLPLGLAIVLRYRHRWRWTWMDGVLVLALLAAGMGDRLKGESTGSTFEYFDALCMWVVPYMAGKVLIEQEDARVITVRRLVMLLVMSALIGTFEFWAESNPFQLFWTSTFFRDPLIFAMQQQVRHGFGRFSGPFTDAELAGIVLFYGIALVLWLGGFGGWGRRFRETPWLPVTEWAGALLVLGVALGMTQSRGPELGCAVAVPIALVGRSRRVGRDGLIVLALLALGGLGAYRYARRYSASATQVTSQVDPRFASEEDQTAAYRAIMLRNYLPIAENDGPFGLGPNFPRIGEQVSVTGVQFSIDNEYLYRWLTMGWVGLGSFVALLLGVMGRALWAGLYGPEPADRAFAFTVLGILAGTTLTLSTVYLGMQVECFTFLLFGWVQSLPVRRAAEPEAGFERVYT